MCAAQIPRVVPSQQLPRTVVVGPPNPQLPRGRCHGSGNHAGDATGAGKLGPSRAFHRQYLLQGHCGAVDTASWTLETSFPRSQRGWGEQNLWAPALHARAHNRRRRFLWRRLLTLCGRLPLGSRGCRAFPPAPPARARARCEKNQQVVAYGGHLIGNVSWASYKGTAAEGRRGYSPVGGQTRQREAHLARRYAPTLDVCRLGATNVLPSSVP